MTESVVALPNNTHDAGVHSPPVLTRARARPSVTQRGRSRDPAAAREQVRARVQDRKIARIWAAVWAAGRHLGAVMYADAADSWIASDSTPSLKTYLSAPYRPPVDSRMLRAYYTTYHWGGFVLLATAHGLLWMLIHPVRGPLFLTSIAGGGVAAFIALT